MVKHITIEEAEKLIQAKKILLIADIRDKESFAQGHLPKAFHLSMTLLEEFCKNSNKKDPLLVYCHHGISSQSAATHLIEKGFKEVYSLTGGFEAWKKHHASDAKKE